MKYVHGGIAAKLGDAVKVEVSVPKPAIDPNRVRFSAWARTSNLFYENPAHGGIADFDRARQFLDACKGKLDDLVLLQTINIQVPKPQPDGPPTGKVLWDSDFHLVDDESPDIAKKLVEECHKRGIGLHAGYCVVDQGNEQGRRGKAFRKFMAEASADQIKDHASQCVALLRSAGFDGLSFDLEINGLSTTAHGPNIKALFDELASQMAGDNLILSYAPYPFQTDGHAPSLPNMNAVPFSLAKGHANVVVRPQAYRGAGESMGVYKNRVLGTIKCALEDVGLDPKQFQVGIDYTGDSVFAAVKGDDMTDVCKLAKEKKVGVCIWRVEWPGSPSADAYTKWNTALNEGAPDASKQQLHAAAGGGAVQPAKQDENKPADPQPQKPPPAAGDQLPADMLGAACFAGLVGAPLTDDEGKFILGLAHKYSTEDQHLKLMRLVYKAYVSLGAAPPAAAGMTSQFVIESDWGRAVTGNFNYFGIKGKPGQLCKTTEHNLSEAAVEFYQKDGRYLGADDPRPDGTVVHHIRDWFRDYANLPDALKHKYELLQHGPHDCYAKHGVLDSPTPEDFCKRIKEAGYATAVDYTPTLINRLKLVDNYAKKKKGKTVEVIQATANADVDPARFEDGTFA